MRSPVNIDLPQSLLQALTIEARQAERDLGTHICEKLLAATPPPQYMKPSVPRKGIAVLAALVEKLPGVGWVSKGVTKDSFWWVKFRLNLDDPMAWQVVQELGFVLNYISLEERLPTVFMPVSAPPYLNGGPQECLDWVIESKYNYIDPAQIAKALEGRLPAPLQERAAWSRGRA